MQACVFIRCRGRLCRGLLWRGSGGLCRNSLRFGWRVCRLCAWRIGCLSCGRCWCIFCGVCSILLRLCGMWRRLLLLCAGHCLFCTLRLRWLRWGYIVGRGFCLSSSIAMGLCTRINRHFMRFGLLRFESAVEASSNLARFSTGAKQRSITYSSAVSCGTSSGAIACRDNVASHQLLERWMSREFPGNISKR